MSRPPAGGGTSVRPGSPVRPPARGASDRDVRRQSADRFVRELISEMKRVTWPTRPEWVSATVLTIVLVVGIGLYTYIADVVFRTLFGLVHR